MIYTRKNVGTCSMATRVELNADHTIAGIEVMGGCNGNLQGVAALVKGMKAEDAIAKMKGIRCGGKQTSCPDQIACALTEALAQMG